MGAGSVQWGGGIKKQKICNFFGLARLVVRAILLDIGTGDENGLSNQAIYCGLKRNRVVI